MAKRLFAWLLVLTLVLSMMPAITLGVTAVGDLNGHTSHEGWTNWGDEESEWTKLPSTAGKYYLTHDVELTDTNTISANVDLCLNGHTVKQTTSGKRHIYLNEGKGITFSLYDCGTTGALIGGSMSTGSVINVTRTNTFNMYGGKITGNISTGDAVVYVQAANATRPTGGVFNMYGGEISGNKCMNGTIYGAGGGASWTNSQVNIYGGTIKDNQATGSGGAIYVKSYGTLRIENATITGNKAKTAGSAIYAQNDTPIFIKNTTITGNIGTSTHADSQTNGWTAAIYTCGAGNLITLSGKVIISGNTTAYANTADIVLNKTAGEKLYVNELSAGSQVVFRTMKADAATADAAVALASGGKQTGMWHSGWISYMDANGQTKNLTYGKDGFYFVDGHYHGDQKFVAWTKTDELPDGDGTTGVGYYLTENVTITEVAKRSTVDSSKVLHLCLNGKTVTQNIKNAAAAENSELIRVSTGSLYLNDCTTVYDKDGYFVSGGKLTGGNKKGNGAALYINKAAAVVEVTGVAFTDNTNTQTSESYGGAAVMARYNTTAAKFVGCKFADNHSDAGGAGAIALRDGGKAIVEKSVFTGNTAKHGGAVYCIGATFTAKDCKFTDNTAANAVAINILGTSNVTIDSCTITGNSNTSNDGYGAVNLANGNSVVKIQGKTVIFDNLNKDGKQQNVHLQHSTTTDIDYDVSGLTAGSKVGITLFKDRITAGVMYFSTTGMTANAGYCVSDNDEYEVKLNDTTTRLELAEKSVTPPTPPAPKHAHKLCNDSACTSHGEAVEFQAWESDNSLPPSGNYYLTKDVKLTAAAETTDDLNLCLNGHTIEQTKDGARVLRFAYNSTNSITDCGTTGTITGGGATYGSAISVRHGATFNLFAGKITGNANESEGTVYLQGGKVEGSDNYPVAATFNMYGGEISGNTTKVGGAISASAPGAGVTQVPAINIYGGKLTGNTTTSRGGAINASGEASIYIQNAEISGNTAGGEGTIYAIDGSTITIKNATIKNNNAKTGAAIATYGGTLTLDGAVIENNHATGGYSAVHAASSSVAGLPTVILKGATVISGNTNGDDNVPMNLYLRNSVMVDVSGLTDAAHIGFTRDSARTQDTVSTAAVDQAQLTRFESDSSFYTVQTDAQGYLVLEEAITHIHKLCNDTACADHTAVGFKAWTKENSLPTEGKYYLTKDVTVSAVTTLTDELVLCLNGHTITQTTENRIFTLNKDEVLSITDCGTTGTITGGKNDYGSVVYLSEGATFNLFGGKLTGNGPKTTEKAATGATVFLRSNDKGGATFNMYGGEITGNGGTKSWGGAVSNGSGHAEHTVYVNMYGGKIYSNTAMAGGAFRLENSVVLTIYGGEITDNTADEGGAIYLNKGAELVLRGGKITNNTATKSGGIAVNDGCKVTVSGAPVVFGNTASDKQNNLYLMGQSIITLGDVAADAQIGVTVENIGRAISNQTDADYTANFTSDSVKVVIEYTNKTLVADTASDHRHCVCLSNADSCDHANKRWQAWESSNTLPTTSGYYYLTSDIQLQAAQSMTANQEIYICLNGKTVKAAEGKRHLATANGTTLSITDCADAPGGFTGGKSNYGGSINVTAGSTLNLYAGRIYGNASTGSEGGAIYIQGGALKSEGQRAGGIFNMYGGEICDNTANTGAGVRSAGLSDSGEISSQFHMYGGSIHDNKAVYEVTVDENGKETKSGGLGGGVALGGGTQMTMQGGSIEKNTSDDDGGAIYMTGKATLHMKDGKISGNSSATQYGGAIFAISNGTTITMDGGEMSGNSAEAGGAVMLQTKAAMTLNGGKISGNTENGSGGAGLYISTNTDFVMNGGEISGNTGSSSGAGFYALRSRVTLNGGTISGNKAATYGGGFRATGATVVMNGVKITGNEAKTGGAAYISYTTETVKGETVYYYADATIGGNTKITGNTATTAGGVYVNETSKLTVSGAPVVTDNKASNKQSNLYLQGNAVINLGELSAEAKVGVSATNGGRVIIMQSAADYSANFISDSTHQVIEYHNGDLFLGATGEHQHCVCNSDVSACDHANKRWQAWESSDTLPTTSGYYYLTSDIQLQAAQSMTANQEIYICLNGKTVKAAEGKRHLVTANGTTLSITDCADAPGGFTGGKSNYGGSINVVAGSTLNLYAGRIYGNAATDSEGGAIYIQGGALKSEGQRAGGIFNMYGGEICDNTANAGAGVRSAGLGDSGEIPSQFHMYGGSIHDNKAVYKVTVDENGKETKSGGLGGGVAIAGGTQMTMQGGIIENNISDDDGGAIYMTGKATLTMKDGKISGNSSATQYGGAIFASGTGTAITMDGGEMSGNSANAGGAVMLQTKAAMTMNGGKITDNTDDGNGGAGLYISTNTDFVMNGGEISGNTSSGSGAGFYALRSRVTLNGGTISGNKAATYGGGFRATGATVVMNGVKITGNEAKTGGAVYISYTTATVKDETVYYYADVTIGGNTKITDNTATTAGGVYVNETTKLTVSGAPVVMKNTASGKLSNLYLQGDVVITLGQLAAEAQIGILVDKVSRAITTETNVDYSANFICDRSYMVISYKDKALYIEPNADHQHCVCDSNVSACDHSKVRWLAWESSDTLPTTSGYYYLTSDIQLKSGQSMTANQEIYICLNGKTVKAAEGKRHLATANGTTLSITDCTENKGGLTGGNSNYGGSINVVAGSTLNLYAGRIYGNTAPDGEGGGVYLQGGSLKSEGQRAGGIFNMYGGEICDNTANTGAGIRSAGLGADGEISSQFHMYGGSIHDNKAVYKVTVNEETKEEKKTGGNGGAIAMTLGTQMTMQGGTIENNTADANGGGIYMLAKATLTIKGGKLSGNATVDAYGGAIFATGNGTTITMDGGELSGNTSKSGGAVMLQTKAFMTMNSGKITANHATSNGAGLYVSTNTDFIMNGGTISENVTGATGAGFYALRSRVTLNGGKITANKAANRGGGFSSGGATVVMNAVTISGNEAKEGGAMYLNRTSATSNGEIVYYATTATINKGAVITGNKAETNCGGVLIANPETVLTMNGGEITKNTAANGAGIMTWSESTFVLKGGKISENKAKSGGGAAYISTNSHFVMEGGSIVNNTAKSAGGIYFLRCDAQLIGGTITGNTAKSETKWSNGKETKSGGTGGAGYISGAKVDFKGTSIVGNYADVNGGGFVTGRKSYVKDGVTQYQLVTVNISGGLFTGNKTDGAGGVFLNQSEGTVMNVSGGTFKNNTAKNAGAIYVSTKTTFNMTGGVFTANHAEASGGALYFYKSTGTVTGGQIYGNTAVTSAGAVMINGDVAKVVIKNIKFHDNTAKTAGAVVAQSKAVASFDNCDFYDNMADGATGGAAYISTRTTANFYNCKFYNNTAATSTGALHTGNWARLTVDNCDFTENTAGTTAGALYINPAGEATVTNSNFTKNTAGTRGGAITCRGSMTMTDCKIEENVSVEEGGAFYTDTNTVSGSGVMRGLVIENSEIRNNTAGGKGGAFYVYKGCRLELYDSQITGNTSAAEGGAIWAYEDTELHNTTITGNVSGGEGYAVYMNDANYDGHSYYTSKNKLSGNTIITDNEGGNLWMGPDVVFAITAEGLGEQAHIELVLDSGKVTNRVLGIYHYEGGDQHYTITYGNRSMTDPEFDKIIVDQKAPVQKEQKVEKKDHPVLRIVLGVVELAVVLAAVVLFIRMKKKKAAKAAQKANKQ